MNDVMLIFVSLYFQLCLRAEALMVAHFSLVIERIKETEWLQQDCTYYSLALFLLIEYSVCEAISFGLI